MNILYSSSGCRTDEHGPILKELFHTDYFKVNVVKDADTVELCGSLKVRLFGIVMYRCSTCEIMKLNCLKLLTLNHVY